MNIRTFIAATLLFSSLLFSDSAVAQANVSGKFSFQEAVSLCWETVDIDGWMQLVSHSRPDGAGGFREILQLTFHGTGQGWFSGEQYVYNGTWSDTHVWNAAGGEARTYMARVRLIGHGWHLDNQLWVDIHFTVTPDGIFVNNWDLEECSVY